MYYGSNVKQNHEDPYLKCITANIRDVWLLRSHILHLRIISNDRPWKVIIGGLLACR